LNLVPLALTPLEIEDRRRMGVDFMGPVALPFTADGMGVLARADATMTFTSCSCEHRQRFKKSNSESTNIPHS
jgi:hypothetical protein